MSNWKKKRAFSGSAHYTTRSIGEHVFRFYPVSVTVMFKLRRLAKPLAEAFSVLFSRNANDFTIIEDQPRRDGTCDSRMNQAIDPQLARFRSEERAAAFTKLVEAFTDESNADIVGTILMDSLREEFSRDPQDRPEPEEIVRDMDITSLIEMLKGVMEANKEVLGPLGRRVQADLAPLDAPEPETVGQN